MRVSIAFFAFIILLFSIAGCTKDELETTRVNIRLTDDPCDCQQVNIDIREVRVKMSGDTSQWISLNTNDGIYDLLLFQNGVDTLIATGNLPLQVLKEVRFILGDQNTVMVDDVLYPLETPSAQSSGLKVKIDKDLALTPNTFVLDFDAAASVKEQNGKYKLHPVIRMK
jgi:hypothetical protein